MIETRTGGAKSVLVLLEADYTREVFNYTDFAFLLVAPSCCLLSCLHTLRFSVCIVCMYVTSTDKLYKLYSEMEGVYLLMNSDLVHFVYLVSIAKFLSVPHKGAVCI